LEIRHSNKRKVSVNVELVQPRLRDARGIDAIAPTPGFTDPQLDRLALVYIAASVRRGQWLIPAFHGVVDFGVGSHDDPQNFDLEHWASCLAALLQEIAGPHDSDDFVDPSVQTQVT